MVPPEEVASLSLPTWAGEFDLRAFEGASGEVYLLFVLGEIGDGRGMLVRLHSGCLTGDGPLPPNPPERPRARDGGGGVGEGGAPPQPPPPAPTRRYLDTKRRRLG